MSETDVRIDRGEATRERLVRAAAYLLHRRGYHGVGLSEILKLAGAPKGVLYHHFPDGKPELAEAAIGLAAEIFARQVRSAGVRSRSRRGFIMAMARLTVKDLERTQFRAGCPLTTIALETAPYDERLSEACRKGFELWIEEAAGHFARLGSKKPRDEAELVLSTLEGALAIARSRQDTSIVTATAKRLGQMPA